jgi:hypothetical protein
MWEFREVLGVRQTFLSGKAEPVWLVAELKLRLGHMGRVAKRLGWTQKQVRMTVKFAEWNSVALAKEREAALAAGFRNDLLTNSPHGLVFPAKDLERKPVRRRRRCWRCR